MTDREWVAGARLCPSPNFNQRPEGADISLVVIHGISLPPGEFGGGHIDELFTNRLSPLGHPYFASIAGLEVSSHFLICRDGELVQYVPLALRAWHAGRSSWRGRENCNDYSVGIELEGADDVPYTDAQYECLNKLLKQLRLLCPSLQEVVGHEHVAPGRKTDPGPAFDWARVMWDGALTRGEEEHS